MVRLTPDDDMHHFLVNMANDKKKYAEITDPDGTAELLIWFPSPEANSFIG